MQRLSAIINEVYRKYLPLAEKGKIKLNLDFPDTTQTITNPEIIKSELEQQLNSALSRTKQGAITISVHSGQIKITDTGTILSKPICNLMNNARVQVKSRVGFGTTVIINLK